MFCDKDDVVRRGIEGNERLDAREVDLKRLGIYGVFIRFEIDGGAGAVPAAAAAAGVDIVLGDGIGDEDPCYCAEFLGCLMLVCCRIEKQKLAYGAHICDSETRVNREMFCAWSGEFDDSIGCHSVPLQLFQDVENHVFASYAR